MTLHQLTHSVGFDSDLGIVSALRRAAQSVAGVFQRWAEARRLEDELSQLDHRELADLNTRR